MRLQASGRHLPLLRCQMLVVSLWLVEAFCSSRLFGAIQVLAQAQCPAAAPGACHGDPPAWLQGKPPSSHSEPECCPQRRHAYQHWLHNTQRPSQAHLSSPPWWGPAWINPEAGTGSVPLPRAGPQHGAMAKSAGFGVRLT